MRSDEILTTSLGQILRKARERRNISLEEAEGVTRISRRYLQALELEEFSILPAPVYARGFLRTYASFLGLEASVLMPLFPVSYLDQPIMQPLPHLQRTPVWSPSWLLGGGAIGILIAVIALLYYFGGDSASPFAPSAISQPEAGGIVPASSLAAETAGDGEPALPLVQGGSLPNLQGRSAEQAIEILSQMGLNYFILEVSNSQTSAGVVIQQSPDPGTALKAGEMVTLVVNRGSR